ncbi:TonB-dependent receptor plug domain-containing protein [Caulobacter segnis]
MSLRETPQSVSIINQDRIKDFALTDVNQLLAQVTGVNVEKVETDCTYYNSRGFDITNFQIDGIGLPLIWGIQFGSLDTVLFEARRGRARRQQHDDRDRQSVGDHQLRPQAPDPRLPGLGRPAVRLVERLSPRGRRLGSAERLAARWPAG